MSQPYLVKFKGELLSEPSGVAQLPDGRFIAVNDTSPDKALFVLELHKGILHAKKLSFPNSPKLNDLEGVALMGNYIYAVSSHAENNSESRRIVRFLIKDDKVCQLEKAKGSKQLRTRIRKALKAKHPKLKKSGFKGDKFNIEGFTGHGNEFLLGLRSPTMNGLAMVVKTSGLNSSFGNNAQKYRISADFCPLNLKGGGIRALAYIPDLKGYLIVSGKGVSGKSKFSCNLANMKSKFLLWFWDGKKHCKEILCFPKKQDGKKIQPEGITPVILDGQSTILIVSDDGRENKKMAGRYWLLSQPEYKALKKNIA